MKTNRKSFKSCLLNSVYAFFVAVFFVFFGFIGNCESVEAMVGYDDGPGSHFAEYKGIDYGYDTSVSIKSVSVNKMTIEISSDDGIFSGDAVKDIAVKFCKLGEGYFEGECNGSPQKILRDKAIWIDQNVEVNITREEVYSQYINGGVGLGSEYLLWVREFDSDDDSTYSLHYIQTGFLAVSDYVIGGFTITDGYYNCNSYSGCNVVHNVGQGGIYQYRKAKEFYYYDTSVDGRFSSVVVYYSLSSSSNFFKNNKLEMIVDNGVVKLVCSGYDCSYFSQYDGGDLVVGTNLTGKYYFHMFFVGTEYVNDGGIYLRTPGVRTVTYSYLFDNSSPDLDYIAAFGDVLDDYKQIHNVSVKGNDVGEAGLNELSIDVCLSLSSTSCDSSWYELTDNLTAQGVLDYSLMKNKTGDYYLHIEGCDMIGNCNTKYGKKVIKIDNKAPERAYVYVSDNNVAKSKMVKAVYLDGHSGTGKIYYCYSKTVNGCDPYMDGTGDYIETKYGDQFVNFSLNYLSGSYYIMLVAIDKAGNRTLTNTAYMELSEDPLVFDNTAPDFENATPSESEVYTKSKTIILNYKDYLDKTAGLVGEVKGIDYCWLEENNENEDYVCESYQTVMGGSASITENSLTGTYYLVHRAYDNSLKGNGGAESDYNYSDWQISGPYKFDNEAPIYDKIEFYEQGSSTRIYDVSVSYIDEHVGVVDEIYYCLSYNGENCMGDNIGVSANNNTIEFEIDMQGKCGQTFYVYIYGVDSLGNSGLNNYDVYSFYYNCDDGDKIISCGSDGESCDLVATNGIKFYGTLQGAFDDNENGTITLLSDVNECDIIVGNGKNLTLQISGYEILCDSVGSHYVLKLENYGKLTVKFSYGDITRSSSGSENDNGAVYIDEFSEFIFYGDSTGDRIITDEGSAICNYGVFEMYDGYVSSQNGDYTIYNSGSAYIYGGVVEYADMSAIVNYGELDIGDDGELGIGDDGVDLNDDYPCINGASGYPSIEGLFNFYDGRIYGDIEQNASFIGKVRDGASVVVNDGLDYLYLVESGENCAVTVEGRCYGSLQSAINSTDSATITLQSTINECDVTISEDKNIVIDMSFYNIICKTDDSSKYTIIVDGELEILGSKRKNGGIYRDSFSVYNSNSSVVVGQGGKLTLINGIIDNLTKSGYSSLENYGVFKMYGGSIYDSSENLYHNSFLNSGSAYIYSGEIHGGNSRGAIYNAGELNIGSQSYNGPIIFFHSIYKEGNVLCSGNYTINFYSGIIYYGRADGKVLAGSFNEINERGSIIDNGEALYYSYVAEDNYGNKYNSVESAFKSAFSNGYPSNKITLLENIYECVDISYNSVEINAELDLAGKKIICLSNFLEDELNRAAISLNDSDLELELVISDSSGINSGEIQGGISNYGMSGQYSLRVMGGTIDDINSPVSGGFSSTIVGGIVDKIKAIDGGVSVSDSAIVNLIESSSYATVDVSGGKVGIIKLIYDYYNDITVSGGEVGSIISEVPYSYDSSDVTVTISGGVIYDGIHLDKQKLVVGTEDGNVSIESPLIISDNDVALSGYGSFEFYDGIIKGKNKPFDSNINGFEEGYHVTLVIIDDYVCAYLEINGEGDEGLPLLFSYSPNGGEYLQYQVIKGEIKYINAVSIYYCFSTDDTTCTDYWTSADASDGSIVFEKYVENTGTYYLLTYAVNYNGDISTDIFGYDVSNAFVISENNSTDYVATNGTKQYLSVQAAITDNNNAIIYLLKNVSNECNILVNIYKNLKLDLSDFSITCGEDGHFSSGYSFDIIGSIEIVNGTINNFTDYTYLYLVKIYNGGQLTISNLSMQNSYVSYKTIIINEGTFIMNSGNLSAYGSVLSNEGTAYINGGRLSADGGVIFNSGTIYIGALNTSLNIENPQIEGTGYEGYQTVINDGILYFYNGIIRFYDYLDSFDSAIDGEINYYRDDVTLEKDKFNANTHCYSTYMLSLGSDIPEFVSMIPNGGSYGQYDKVEITISYTDEDDDIDKIYYCFSNNVDNCSWHVVYGSDSITINKRFDIQENFYLFTYAVDYLGNSSALNGIDRSNEFIVSGINKIAKVIFEEEVEYFDTIDEAFDYIVSIGGIGEVELMNNVNECVSVYEGVNEVKFDIHGYTFTCSEDIDLNVSIGTLRIVDEIGNGYIDGRVNAGSSLNIESGRIKIVTMDDSGGTINVTGGIIEELINGDNIVNISNYAYVKRLSINHYAVNVNISGGVVEEVVGNNNVSYLNFDISDGNVGYIKDIIFSEEGERQGVINITGGTIGEYTSIVGNVVVNEFAVYNVSNVVITGGRIKGTSKGIWVLNGNVVSLGEKNDIVSSISNPSVTATNGVGVVIENGGTFNFYDGLIQGTTATYSGNISDVEEGYQVVETQLGGYTQAYLDIKYAVELNVFHVDYYESEYIYHTSLQDAFNDASIIGSSFTEFYITLLSDVNECVIMEEIYSYYDTVIFDPNGYSLTCNEAGESALLVNGFLRIEGEGFVSSVSDYSTKHSINNYAYLELYSSNVGVINFNNNSSFVYVGGKVESLYAGNYSVNIVSPSEIKELIVDGTTASVNISGGKIGKIVIDSSYYKNSSINISGATIGYIECIRNVSKSSQGTININGGIITGSYVWDGVTYTSEFGTYNVSLKVTSSSATNDTIIQGTLYGVWLVNGNTLTLGTNGDGVIDSPVITATNANGTGVYIQNGSVNFYDGIIKGKGSAYNNPNNTSIVIEQGYQIQLGELDGYKVAILVSNSGNEAITRIPDQDGEIVVEHETLQAAFDYAASFGGEIELLRNVNRCVTMSNSTVTLDLNGFSIKCLEAYKNAISVNGNLTITDESSSKAGRIIGGVTDADDENDGYSPIVMNLVNGRIDKMDFSDTGHTINISGGRVDYLESGDYEINISDSANVKEIISYVNARIYVSGGTVGSIKCGGIYVDSSTIVNISGGNIGFISDFYDASYNSSIVYMSGGNITGNYTWDGVEYTNDYGVYNSSMTLTGGTVLGSKYGIWVNGANVVLGTADATVSKAAPVITGHEIGLYVESGNVEFYDGLLRGINSTYRGVINVFRGYEIKTVKSINYVGYESYLVVKVIDNPLVKVIVGGLEVVTESINEAIDIVEDYGNGKIVMLNNTTECFTIYNLEIIFDLNGYTVTCNDSYFEFNDSVISIVDESSQNNGLLNGIVVSNGYINSPLEVLSGGITKVILDKFEIGIRGSAKIKEIDVSGEGTLNISEGFVGEIFANEDNNNEIVIDGGNIGFITNVCSNYCSVIMNGGNITGSYEWQGTSYSSYNPDYEIPEYAVYNTSMKVYGGSISASGVGIWLKNNLLIIGNNDGNVLISSPSILATDGIGLVNEFSNVVYFYDGIIKGKNAAYDVDSFVIETNYELTTEIISGYYSAYLTSDNVDVAKTIIEDVELGHKSLQDAVDYIETYGNGTIVLLKDVVECFIVQSVDVILDLNGFTIICSSEIVVEGSSSKSGNIYIYNNNLSNQGKILGKVTVNDYGYVQIDSGYFSDIYIDSSYGSSIISGGTIENLNIDDSTVNISGDVNIKEIYMDADANLQISDGNIGEIYTDAKDNYGHFWWYDGKLTIEGGIIGFIHKIPVIEMNGGIITGSYIWNGVTYTSDSGIYANRGSGSSFDFNLKIEIKGGSVTGINYGLQVIGINLTIGDNDGTVSIENPKISSINGEGISFSKSVVNNAGVFYFYDGIIQGVIRDYSGIEPIIPDGYRVKHYEENGYKKARLQMNIGNVKSVIGEVETGHQTLKEAFDYIISNGGIGSAVLLENVNESIYFSNNNSISSANIELDLNGYGFNSLYGFAISFEYNLGYHIDFTISDSSNDNGYIMGNINIYYYDVSVVVTGGTVGSIYGFNGSSITINGGIVESVSGSESSITIEGDAKVHYVSSIDSNLDVRWASTIDIIDISCMYCGGSSSISGKIGYINISEGSTVYINDGEVVGSYTWKGVTYVSDYGISNRGILYVDGGMITGSVYGIDTKESSELYVNRATIVATNTDESYGIHARSATVSVDHSSSIKGYVGIANKYGNLSVYNSYIDGLISHGIYNNGVANINGGIITSKDTTGKHSGIFNAVEGTLKLTYGGKVEGFNSIFNKGTFTMDGGTIESINYSIINESNITINDGTIKGGIRGISNTSGTVNVKGGIIKDVSNGIYITSGEVTVSGSASISGEVGINSKSRITVSGGTIIGSSRHGVYLSEGGILNATGGIIKSNNTTGDFYGVFIDETSSATISENVIINGYNGINNKNELDINGGKIEVSNYGVVNIKDIEMNAGTIEAGVRGISNSVTEDSIGIVTINGGSVKASSGSATSKVFTYGIYIQDGVVNINENAFVTGYVAINNKGELNITGGTITGILSHGVYNNENGTINMSGGSVNTEDEAIIDEGNNNVDAPSGVTVGKSAGIFIQSGTLTMSGGTIGLYDEENSIISGAPSGVINKQGTVTITGGSIYAENAGVDNSGDVTIENIIIVAGYRGVLSNGDGVTNVTNVTINSVSGTGIYNIQGEVNLDSVVVIANVGVGSRGGTTNINSGTIGAISHGIYSTGGTVNIGEIGGEVSVEIPSITSEDIGLYISEADVYMYDGIIKGKTVAYIGIIKGTEEGYNVIVEVIDGYSCAYLTDQPLFEPVARGYNFTFDSYELLGDYPSVQAALDVIPSIGKVILLVNVSECVVIDSSKSIVLDLGGFTLTSCNEDGVTLTSHGDLEIVDESEKETLGIISGNNSLVVEEGETIINSNITLSGNIAVNGSLIINNGTYNANITNSNELVVNNGDIKNTINNSGNFDIYGGNINNLVNVENGDVDISSSTVNYISNSADVVVRSGEIISIINNEESVITIGGGLIHSITNKGNTVVNGGEIHGIENTDQGVVDVNGGLVTSDTKYAISNGTLNFTGGTIKAKKSASVLYSYSVSSLNRSKTINDTTTTYSEYTIIEDGYYVTVIKTGVAKVGEVIYNTIEEAIEVANLTNKVHVLENVTITQLGINRDVGIYLSDGIIVNNYIKEMSSSLNSIEYSAIVVSADYSVSIENGTIETLANNATIVHNYGTFTLDANLNATDSLAVINEGGAKFIYNSGTMKSKDDNVFSSANRDLYVKENHYIVYTTKNDGFTETSLSEGNIIVSNVEVKSILDKDNVVTVYIKMSGFEGNISFVSVYLKSNLENEYEKQLECVSNEEKKEMICSVSIDDIAYLSNLGYSNELVIKYYDDNVELSEEEMISNITKKKFMEIDKVDFKIINSSFGKGEKIEVEGNNQVITDGQIIFIDLYDASGVTLNSNDLKMFMFNSNFEKIIAELELEYVGYDSASCSSDEFTIICPANIQITKMKIKDDSPVPTNLNISGIVYNMSPKLTDSSGNAIYRPNFETNICQVGEDCSISSLSFKDYTGNDVASVENIITLNGMVVDNVNTSVLGNYVITTRAIDVYGNSSETFIREYKVVDNIAPIVTLDEVVVVKKGHTYSDSDIVVSDNYDEKVKIEKIDSDINFDKVGTYKVGYRFTDSSGNETIVYRTIVVKENSNVVWYLVGALSAIVCLFGAVLIKKRKYFN